MRDLKNDLQNKLIVYPKLLKYGFSNIENYYCFKKNIIDNQFEFNININNEEVTTYLLDISNNEEYILVDIEGTTGEFVGKVREEYRKEIDSFIKNCTVSNIFKYEQTKQVIEYIRNKYGDELEFLWKKYDNNAIWRNKVNQKWYGVLLTIPESKLNIDSDRTIEIIDLRFQKDLISDAIDNITIFPGYHMNKKSWITIKLDDTLKIEKIFELIDNSYQLNMEKHSKINKC